MPRNLALGRDQREDTTMTKDPVDDAIETILDDQFIDDLNGGDPTDGWGDV